MKNKIFDYLLIGLVLLGIIIWSTVSQNASANIAEGSAKIFFLDVGQGDSALISLPNKKQILIDTGKSSEISNLIRAKMPAFDNEIEKIILTHFDSDHAGGMPAILDSYKVDEVYINTDQSDSKLFGLIEEKLKTNNVNQKIIKAGDNIYEGALKINILWPAEKTSGLSENNLSIVARIENGKSKALFSGDIEIEGQNKILEQINKEDLVADLYKVSHHGSGGAYNENFLKVIEAKNAVISVGKNSYGHPAQTVVEGLAKLGMKIYRTDQMGTLEFASSDNGWVFIK